MNKNDAFEKVTSNSFQTYQFDAIHWHFVLCSMFKQFQMFNLINLLSIFGYPP